MVARRRRRPRDPMRVLGIDCGSRSTGYGIIDSDEGRQQPVVFGAISLPAKHSLGARLVTVHRQLRQLIDSYTPQVAAVEDQFYLTNFKSVMKLGQVKGVVICTAALAGVPIVEYSPLEIKNAVTGYGRADKQQVQAMVGRLLGLASPPQPHDAADALALALCHAQVMTTEYRIRTGISRTNVPLARR